MTPQKAIEKVKGCGLNMEGQANAECESVILEALEKQIPKKAELKRFKTNFGFKGYLCPNCEEVLRLNNEGYIKYCPHCGQALIGGEEE